MASCIRRAYFQIKYTAALGPYQYPELVTCASLVPRVLRLFGQWVGARRDFGVMEFLQKNYLFDWLIIKQRNSAYMEPET